MRILVFQTAYLGDVVLTTPLLASLRKNLPDAHIACAVQPAWAPVLEHSHDVDQVIAFDKRGSQAGNAATIRFGLSLRKEKFDVALCPHPSFRSGLILRLAGIPFRVGFETSAGRSFFNRLLPRDAAQHEVKRVLSLAGAVGVDPAHWIDTPHVRPDPGIDPDAILQRYGVEPGQFGVVGVHPGSVWKTKRWLPERFARVCRIIGKRGFTVLVFGAEKERSLVDRVVNAADQKSIRACVGLSLPELMAAFTRLALYITNDSGPMHIACALGIPVIAVFGSTVPAQGYAPYSQIATVVQAERLDCRPCGPHGHNTCPLDHFDCMNKVEPESVLLAARVLTGGFAGTGFINVLFNEKEGI